VTVSGTQPSTPTSGQLWYDTVTLSLKIYNGSAFVPVAPEHSTWSFSH
jgi:hypothetical protein